MTRMSDIPPELLAEMTPAVRAFVESLLVQMAEMQARMQAEIDELKAQVKKLTEKRATHLDGDLGEGYCLHVEMSTIF